MQATSLFKPATRHKLKLRAAIDGVSGSGKTFTALRFAAALGQRIAVINSESGAVEKYLGLAPDGIPFQFDVCELNDFSPSKYTEAILAAGQGGYDVIVIDSLSHAWNGAGGALELKDRKGGNSYTAWKDITPIQNRMIEAILRSPAHVIVTMRSKTEHVLEPNGQGKMVPKKVGMAPIQRQGVEYEFDLYCSIDSEHIMQVTKSRCPDVANAITVKPGASFLEPVTKWLNDGSEAPPEMFAVTEEDLRKFEQRRKSEEPPKTARELMEEAKAKADAEAQSVTTEAGSATPGEGAETTIQAISNDQVARLETLFVQTGASDEDKQAILRKRNTNDVRLLTAEQASELINKLEAVATSTPAAGSESAGQTRINESDPCTDYQVQQIKADLETLEKEKPGTCQDFVSRLNGAGFAKIADLTHGQAIKLHEYICQRSIEAFFESDLQTAAAG